MREVPACWRFHFDGDTATLRDLDWPEVVRAFRDFARGDLSAEAGDEHVSFQFNAEHAAVLYMRSGAAVLRPYFPDRSAESQDLSPFFCDCCGVQLGDPDEYLSRFLDRQDGFRLFEALLHGPGLPDRLPIPHDGHPRLPGFDEGDAEDERSIERSLEWRPMPKADDGHAL
ncbi:MAG: hypothetical protein BGO49_28095 [Planctomycetales bacterium 71-10]|nr:MAG: hypothetical protein BGO49_28095 [Planctomycetales bacterium 71-10]